MAEQEFERLCDTYGVDTDMSGEKPETVEGFEDLKRKICKAISAGHLTVSDSGRPEYTTQDGTRLAFGDMTGAVLLEMDKHKDGQNNRKMFAILGALTGGVVSPSRLRGRDVKVLFALAALFLAG